MISPIHEEGVIVKKRQKALGIFIVVPYKIAGAFYERKKMRALIEAQFNFKNQIIT